MTCEYYKVIISHFMCGYKRVSSVICLEADMKTHSK